MGVFLHLAGGELKKSLHETEEGRKQAHLWLEPGAPPPFSDHNPYVPQGKVWQRERETKGGVKERGRKRLSGRFTSPHSS